MYNHHQDDIFNSMQSPEFYPHPVRRIEQRDTHISKVFLTGDYVYKIKKPVNLGFLDFTTLEKRRHFCWQEVVLNRRLTKNVYLDMVAITFHKGQYVLSGPGEAVEYAVKMRQLPEQCSMLRLIRNGRLSYDAVDSLARFLSQFYAMASTTERINHFGSWETVQANCEENFHQTAAFVGHILDDQKYQIIRAATRAFLRRHKWLFTHRIEQNKIRDCHGDLRAGHIYFKDGIQILDCIEFNDRFRYSDITADLSFLAMDLDFEGHWKIADQFIEAYVRYTRDKDVLVLLDFYKCYRAFVRVKVNCFQLQENNLKAINKDKLLKETRRYLSLAYRYAVQFARPTLWVVCGMPASGKSTIAKELGRTLDIGVVESDAVRKALFRIKPHISVDVPFETGIYSRAGSSLTYGKLLIAAQEVLEKGDSIILAATFSRKHQRQEALRLARDMDVNIFFIQCVASDEVLKERLKLREHKSSLSDARLHHFDEFKRRFEPLTEVPEDIHVRINTEKPLEDSMETILSHEHFMLSKMLSNSADASSM
ncbi:MAG: AAA family ATPase [Deltaproteobacteria bacterium]|nr:AAA family ATPase [Deltaproteobacteria bacterium]